MAHLYKFTCKPNHPVVSEAVLVVYTCAPLDSMIDVLADMASSRGFAYAGGNSTATYLGYFEPTGVAEMSNDGILVCITGEY